jgi:S1-C subfamily serine protease
MRRSTLILLLLLGWFTTKIGRADDSDLNQAVGSVIDVASGKGLGTGFIIFGADGKAIVLTAYHVTHGSKARLRLPGGSSIEQDLKLSLLRSIPEEDLVSFSIDEPHHSLVSVFKWSRKKADASSEVSFWGVDFTRNTVFGQQTVVDSCGRSMLENGSPIEFIDFRGDTSQGFSGSPVFLRNTREVIGIVISGWFQCSIDGTKKVMMNRSVIPRALTKRQLSTQTTIPKRPN